MTEVRVLDDDGVPVAGRLELVDATPAMRDARRTEVVIEASAGGIRLVKHEKDAKGKRDDERMLPNEAWDALVRAVIAVVPLGTTRDLVGEKRSNKGVSFNHLTLTLGGVSARVDYLPSHVDEDDGDDALRALVQSVKAA